MELPVIRQATEDEFTHGRMCQRCTHWIRDENSYGHGVCKLGGHDVPPRWTIEIRVCDGFAQSGERT